MLLQNNIFKMKILASVSHELRTPLNYSNHILNELYSNSTLSDEVKEKFIFPALCQNELLSLIVNDICDYLTMETGNFFLNFNRFSLKDLFEEVSVLFLE
jgi:signal transduction histidine kinase